MTFCTNRKKNSFSLITLPAKVGTGDGAMYILIYWQSMLQTTIQSQIKPRDEESMQNRKMHSSRTSYDMLLYLSSKSTFMKATTILQCHGSLSLDRPKNMFVYKQKAEACQDNEN